VKERAEKEKAERQEQRNKTQQQRTAFVAGLAGPHRAVVLDEEREMTWTSEVQDAFMPLDGEPVAGVAGLTDVERDGKGFVTRLVYGGLFRSTIVLVLQCDPPADTPDPSLIGFGERMFADDAPQYAFVAKINSVRALRYVVNGEGGVDVKRFGWTAEGKCLALRKMPVEAKSASSEQSAAPVRGTLPRGERASRAGSDDAGGRCAQSGEW
jgi:hypothetical protein